MLRFLLFKWDVNASIWSFAHIKVGIEIKNVQNLLHHFQKYIQANLPHAVRRGQYLVDFISFLIGHA